MNKQKQLLEEAQLVSSDNYRKLPPPKLFELNYMTDNYKARSRQIKLATYLSMVLLAIYGIAEYINLGAGSSQAAFIRYLVIIPGLYIFTIIFDKPKFMFFQDWLIIGTSILICISMFINRYAAYEQGEIYYYYGYLLIVCFINIVVHPRFIPAVIASTIIYISSISFFYFLGLKEKLFLFMLFDSSFFIFLSLLSNYYLNLQKRKTYATELLQNNLAQKDRKLQKELIKLSNLDSLTQVPNRRFFDENHNKYDRTDTGILFIDIDYFKNYNDNYGHLAGDECLTKVAQSINSAVRNDDLFARYGGEEFVILMSNASRESTYQLAQRIYENILTLAIPHEGAVKEVVTVSIGWSIVDAANDLHSSLEEADKALYQAKNLGRNQIYPEDHKLN